eukprot:COSAG02_NODE_43005_length_379_cov_0.689286_1_plen_81_part_01
MDTNAQQQRARDETALLGSDVVDGPQCWAAARRTGQNEAECIDNSCVSLGAHRQLGILDSGKLELESLLTVVLAFLQDHGW